jgi:hypothetical protein
MLDRCGTSGQESGAGSVKKVGFAGILNKNCSGNGVSEVGDPTIGTLSESRIQSNFVQNPYKTISTCSPDPRLLSESLTPLP